MPAAAAAVPSKPETQQPAVISSYSLAAPPRPAAAKISYSGDNLAPVRQSASEFLLKTDLPIHRRISSREPRVLLLVEIKI